MASAQREPTAPQVEDEPEGLSRTAIIAMCSVVGILVLGCVLFLVWDSKSSHQQKISDANVAVSSAVTEAQEWLSNGNGEADAIENALADSLQNQFVTEKSEGETILASVQKRRAEIVADAIFDTAKEKLGQKEIAEAVFLLKKYVADPNATKKSEAQGLLSQAEIAMSDKLALDKLNSMSDEEFDRVKTTGVIGDGKVTHPILLAARKDTVQNHLESVGKQREEIRIAEEKRRNAERLAAIERKRQEDERKRAEAVRKIAEIRRIEKERAETEQKNKEAINKVALDLAKRQSKKAEAAFVLYFTSLTMEEQEKLALSVQLMTLMWTENKMDDPRFANSLLISSKNREIMQGLLKLKPIVGPIVRERKDGTWTTQDKIISESLTIMTEAIKNNP